MAKQTFSSLKLKFEPQIVDIVNFNGKEIEIIQYISTEQKRDLIDIALQKAEENGIYNPILLDSYFHLYLIYMYTNLTFTDKQKEDELKLFDIIKESGLLDEIIKKIPKKEYDYLFNNLTEYMGMINKYKNTAGSVLQTFVNDLPRNTQAALDIVNNFDKDKFQQVVQFAQVANGNRNIETNLPVEKIQTQEQE